MPNVNFLYTTAPDAATANSIARALIEARLAACVNSISGMKSIYRWQGEIESADEVVLIVKTTAEAAPRARDLICAYHPGKIPCVVAFATIQEASNPAFLDWIATETAP